MARAREKYRLSERQACRIVGQLRGTQRYSTIVRADEDALTQAIIGERCRDHTLLTAKPGVDDAC